MIFYIIGGGIFLDNKFNKAKEIVDRYNQQHILKFYENLDDKKREELLDQILGIDFESSLTAVLISSLLVNLFTGQLLSTTGKFLA